jgi:predicted nucleotidyltransferase
MNRQEIMQTIRKHKSFFLAHGVKQLGIFGSYARDEAREDSDIDLIVEFDKGMKSYDNFIEISFFLENLFGRKIDLLTSESISPFFKSYIDKDVYYETIH